MTDEPKPATPCPKCNSVEWFPGAACWHCGWEGSAADAYALALAERDEQKARADAAERVLSAFFRVDPEWYDLIAKQVGDAAGEAPAAKRDAERIAALEKESDNYRKRIEHEIAGCDKQERVGMETDQEDKAQVWRCVRSVLKRCLPRNPDDQARGAQGDDFDIGAFDGYLR